MDYTQLLLGAITFILVAIGSGLLVNAIKTGKIKKEETTNLIYTSAQVLELVHNIVKAITDDDRTVDIVYNVLKQLMAEAEKLVQLGEIDKQGLIDQAFLQCEIVGIVLEPKDKLILISAVELIYLFVSK